MLPENPPVVLLLSKLKKGEVSSIIRVTGEFQKMRSAFWDAIAHAFQQPEIAPEAKKKLRNGEQIAYELRIDHMSFYEQSKEGPVKELVLSMYPCIRRSEDESIAVFQWRSLYIISIRFTTPVVHFQDYMIGEILKKIREEHRDTRWGEEVLAMFDLSASCFWFQVQQCDLVELLLYFLEREMSNTWDGPSARNVAQRLLLEFMFSPLTRINYVYRQFLDHARAIGLFPKLWEAIE